MAQELRIYERPTLERPVLIGGVPRLERRRAGGDARRRLPREAVGTRTSSPTSTRSSSSTSRRRGRSSRWTRASTRKIEWPENTFYRARIPGTSRDAVILVGVEPNYRWRTFTELVADLARDLGVELVVTLGALLADVPHTRPAPVTGRGDRPEARRRARPPALALRGADRDRRRPARRVPARRDPVGQPVGRGAALRLARAEPAGRAGAVRAARRGVLGVDIDIAELAEAETSYVEQVSEAVATRLRDGRVRRGARAARRLARLARGVGRAPVRRGARRRDHALPARARRERRQSVGGRGAGSRDPARLSEAARGGAGAGARGDDRRAGAERVRRLARRHLRHERAQCSSSGHRPSPTRRASSRAPARRGHERRRLGAALADPEARRAVASARPATSRPCWSTFPAGRRARRSSPARSSAGATG